jgi:uncharacterized protein (TIGR02118 family)
MHVLTVCYGHPTDPAAFDEHYNSTHVPLASKIPGVSSYTWRHCASLDDNPPPYFMVAELSWPTQAAMGAAMSSPEAQAAVADVPNFASGGVTMFVAYDE